MAKLSFSSGQSDFNGKKGVAIGLEQAFYLLFSFVSVVFFEGYVFGTGDITEMLTYAGYLHNPALYASDFYLQSIAGDVPNERWVFSGFLALMGSHMETGALISFTVVTLLLLAALYRMTGALAGDKMPVITRWAIVLAAVIPLNGINLGGNELYYNNFLPGTLAGMLAAWAAVFWLEGKLVRAYMFLIVTTLIHPITGSQLFLLVTGAEVFTSIIKKNKLSGSLAVGILVYSLVCLPWLWLIFSKFNGGNISSATFMEIITFRLPHHFIPSYFSFKGYVLIGGLVAAALYVLFTPVQPRFIAAHILKKTELTAFYALAISGLIVYFIGVQYFKSTLCISTQWFSTTIWLKTFSIILLSIFVVEKIVLKYLNSQKTIALFLLLILFGAAFLQWRTASPREYHFPWSALSDDKEMALQAGKRTPQNALFLVPPDFMAFPYYSKRSNYISYKEMVHKKTVMSEWYRRIKEVYGVDMEDRLAGNDPVTVARSNWEGNNTTDFAELARKTGAGYLIAYRGQNLLFPKLYENESFALYQFK